MALKVSSSAIAKTIKRYDETGSHEDRYRKGRVSSAAEDKFIAVTSLRNCSPNKWASTFERRLHESGHQIKLYLSHVPNATGVDVTVKCLLTSP
jgi:transposase